MSAYGMWKGRIIAMEDNQMELQEMRKEEYQKAENQNGGIQKETRIQEIHELQPAELAAHIGETVMVHGSIYKIRKMHGFCFVILRTARYTIQCICDRKELTELLTEEACVKLTAEVVKEDRAKLGAELHIVSVERLSVPAAQPPIVINQKLVDTSLENKLDFRPLTLRNEKERAVFRIQEGILRGFRRFFEREHFVEIHSPKIVSEGAEGGANIFRLDYFGKEAYLAQSPQFYKQMMVGVFERVYEIGPVFRAEKHDTARHLNEYTGVDFEMGYIESFYDIMAMEVKMLEAAFDVLAEEYAYELSLLGVELPELAKVCGGREKPGLAEVCGDEEKSGLAEVCGDEEKPGLAEVCGDEEKPGLAKTCAAAEERAAVEGSAAEKSGFALNRGGDFASGWVSGTDGRRGIPVLTFAEAKRLAAEALGREPKECHDFEPEEEKMLSEAVKRLFGSEFVFVTHYPAKKRPFYVMEDSAHPGETLSFDLIFRGLEITTGGQRIHEYGMQLAKMKERGMDAEDFESYLMMHKAGMPPHGGLGLGLERLTARLLGFDNVRQASLFPRDIHRLTP